MEFIKQQRLMLWKHWTIRKRQPVILLLEFLWPIAIFLIITSVRHLFPPEPRSDCIYRARAMPSAGLLPFMQSFLCNLDNKCENLSSYEEIPIYKNGKVNHLLNKVYPLIGQPEVHTILSQLPTLITLASHAVKSLSTKESKDILSHQITVEDLFKNKEVITNVLVQNNLNSDLTQELLDSQIDLGQLIHYLTSNATRNIACLPDELINILKFRNKTDGQVILQSLCRMIHKPTVIHTFVVQLNIRSLIEKGAVILDNFGSDDMAAVLRSMGKVVDGLQSIPILENLASAPLGAETEELSAYLQHAMEFLKTLKDFNLDLDFLGELMDDIERVIGPGEVMNHMKSIGKHIHRIISWSRQGNLKDTDVDTKPNENGVNNSASQNDNATGRKKNTKSEIITPKELAEALQDMLVHITYIGNKFGGSMRDVFPAFDITWKVATTAIAIALLPDQNNTVAFVNGLASVFETLPGYLPTEMRMPGLYLITSIEVLLNIGVNITRNIADVNQILLNDINTNGKVWDEMSFDPETFMYLAGILNSKDILKVLSLQPSEINDFVCNSTSIIYPQSNDTENMHLKDLQNFLCRLPVEKLASSISVVTNRELFISQIETTLTMNGETDVDTSFRNTIRHACVTAWELVEIFQNLTLYTSTWQELVSKAKIITKEDPKWKMAVLNLRAAAYNLMIDLYTDVIGEKLVQNSFSGRNERVMNNVGTTIALISEEFLRVPDELFDKVATYWPWVIQIFLDSLLNEEKVAAVVNQQKWAAVLCNQTEIDHYLIIPDEVHSQEFLEFLCTFSTFVENEILNVNWFEKDSVKKVREMIDEQYHNYTKIEWKKTVTNVRDMFSKFGNLASSSLDSIEQIEALYVKTKLIFTTLNITNILKLSMNAFTTIMEFVDRQLETVIPWGWKHIKALISVLDIFIQYTNQELKKILQENKVETGSLTFGLQNFTNLGRKIIRAFPEFTNALTQIFTSRLGDFIGRIFQVVRLKAVPCNGLSMANIIDFSEEGLEIILDLENTACTNWKFVISEIIQYPMMFKMLWKFREATRDKDLPVNWTETLHDVHQLIDYSTQMVNFKGAIFPDVEGFILENANEAINKFIDTMNLNNTRKGLSFATVILDAMIPLMENLIKKDWLLKNVTLNSSLMNSFDEYSLDIQSELSYIFVKTVMKTFDVILSEMKNFYQNLKGIDKSLSMFTHLPTLFGEMFQSFPHYINSFLQFILKGDLQTVIDKNSGPLSFNKLCDFYIGNESKQIGNRKMHNITNKTVFSTLCKLLIKPELYFSSEPFVYSWMTNSMTKIDALWKNVDPSLVIVHFVDIIQGIGFSISEVDQLVGNRLEVKKEFNNLVGNAKWNDAVGSIARLIVKLRIENLLNVTDFDISLKSPLNSVPAYLVCLLHGSLRTFNSELKSCVDYSIENQLKSSCESQSLFQNSSFSKFWKFIDDHIVNIVKILYHTVTRTPNKIKPLLSASNPVNLTCSSAESLFTVPELQINNESNILLNITQDFCQIQWDKLIEEAAIVTGEKCLPSTKNLLEMSDEFADFLNHYFAAHKLKLPNYMLEKTWKEVFNNMTLSTQERTLNVTQLLSVLIDNLFELDPQESARPILKYLNTVVNVFLETVEVINTPLSDNIWKSLKMWYGSKPQTIKILDVLEDIPKLASTFLNTALHPMKLRQLLKTIWTFDSTHKADEVCQNFNISSNFVVSPELEVSFNSIEELMCTANWKSSVIELTSSSSTKSNEKESTMRVSDLFSNIDLLMEELLQLSIGKIGIFKASINELPWTKKGEWRSAVVAIDKIQQNLKDPNLLVNTAVQYLSIMEEFPIWNEIEEYLQFVNFQFAIVVGRLKALKEPGALYSVLTNATAMKDVILDIHTGVKKATQVFQQYAVTKQIQYFDANPNDTEVFCTTAVELQKQDINFSKIENILSNRMTLNQLLSVFCNMDPNEWLNILISDFDIPGSDAIGLIKNMMTVLPKNVTYHAQAEWNKALPFNWTMLLNSFRSVNRFIQNPPTEFYPNFSWEYWMPVFRTFGLVLPDIIRLSGETVCPLLPRINYAPFKDLILLINGQLLKSDIYEKLVCDLPFLNLTTIYHRLKHDLDLIETFRMARIHILNVSLLTIEEKDSSCPPMFLATSNVAERLNELIVKYVDPIFIATMQKCFQHETQAVIVKEIDKYSKLISKGMPLLNFPNITSFTSTTDVKFLVETILDYMKLQVPVFISLKNVLVSNSTLSQVLKNTPGEEILDGMINLNMLASTDFQSRELVKLFCNPTKFSKFVKVSSSRNGELKEVLTDIFCPNGDYSNGIEISEMFIKSLDINKITNILPRLRMDNLLSWNLVVSVGKNIGKLGASFVDIKSAMGNINFNKAFDDLSVQGIIRLMLPIVHVNSLQKLTNGLEIMVEVLSPIIYGSAFEDKLVDIKNGIRGLYNFLQTSLRNETILVKDMLNDITPISDYLLSVGYPEVNIESLLNTTLNISVLLFEKKIENLEDIFCDLNIMPVLFNLESDLTTAGLLHTALCEGQSIEKINTFMKIIFGNLNIISILKNEMHLFMDPIAQKLNLDNNKVKEALNSLYNAQKLFPIVTKTFYSLQEDTNIANIVSHLNPSELLKGEISSSLISSFGNMLCGHAIRTFEEYFRLLQTTVNRPPVEKEKQELQSLPSEFCQNMYKQVAYRPAGSVVWGFLKPFVRGKLLFAPDNEYTRKIITQINITFDSMSSSIDLLNEWSAGFKYLQSFIEEQLKDMEALIKLPIPNSISNALLGPNITRSAANVSAILNDLGNPQRLLGAASALTKGLQCFELNRFIGFTTEEQLERAALNLKKSSSFLAGIVFNNFSSEDIKKFGQKDKLNALSGLPKHIQYKIRMDIDDVPTTKMKKERFWKPGPEDNFIENLRYLRGFVEFQDLVDRAIINMQSGNENSTLPGTFVQQFPYPCYAKDDFGYFLRANVPAVTTLAWIFIVAIFVRELILDRELMVYHVMLVMGLKSWISWFSWFSNCVFVMLVTNISAAIILKFGGVFPNSDLVLLFVFLFIFSLSTIMFCYLVSIWFEKATVAAIAAVLLYLLSYIPFIVVLSLESHLAFYSRILLNLLMSTAFSQGCIYIARFEEQTEGIQWSNIWKSPIFGDDMCLGWTCIMMIVDSIIYFLIAAYCSSLMSIFRQNAKKKWYMIFYPIFSIVPGLKNDSRDRKLKHIDPIIKRNSFGNAAKQDSKAKVGIAIRNLSKVYYPSKSVQTVAVEDLSLDLYEGQITSLLGQSGSGKTTIINMLIGLITPKSGFATIYDRNIISEFEEIRKHLGFCPQYNTLFELMTIREHLEFFGQLKGHLSGPKLQEDISILLDAMKLREKENERACNLSGGIRRRLSVAIAFVGGSRTVILDEPTSGVDPVVRRSIWDLVTKSKKGRTILLTTHHMDEAEIISDSVLIIHYGQTLCHGTPMELKKQFGSGYVLNVAKSVLPPNNEENLASGSESKAMSSNFKDLMSGHKGDFSVYRFAKHYIPNAYLLEENSSNLVLCLPYNNEDGTSNQFGEFFKNFDEHKLNLGIKSYDITCSTLEQVFMNICLQADAGLPITSQGQKILVLAKSLKAKTNKPLRDDILKTNEFNFNLDAITGIYKKPKSNRGCEPWLAKSLYQVHYKLCSGTKLKSNQFKWLLIKRLQHFSRNWRAFITGIILPCVFVAMAMGFTLIRPPVTHSSPSLLLTPSTYGPFVSSFIKVHPRSNMYSKNLAERMKLPPGIGTTCMADKPGGTYPACQSHSEIVRLSFNKQQCHCDTPGNSVCDGPTMSFTYDKETANTTDIIYDLISGNVTDWLIGTHNDFIEQRYGGWLFGVSRPFDSIPGSEENVIGWFNNKGYHAMPSYINSINNALLREEMNRRNDTPSEYGISTYNHPLHLSKLQLGMEALMHHVADVGIAIIFLIAFSFIPAGFVVYLVKERVQGEKRLQYLSGVGPLLYWSVSAFFDILLLTIPVGLSAIIITIFDLPIYMYGHNFIATLVMLFMFGWATTPLMYILEKFFNEPSLASIVLFCINVFIGINTTVCTLLFYLFQKNEAMRIANEVLHYLFLIFPQFALASGLVELTKNYIQSEVFMRFGDDTYISPFSMNILGLNLIVLGIEGIVFFTFNLILEYIPTYFAWFLRKELPIRRSNEDANVRQEREKVTNSNCAGDLIRLTNLTKIFNSANGELTAVNNLCLSVPKGECFGLLGINGAGKTTTFHMLTGEIIPSSGEIFYKDKKLSQYCVYDSQNVGYCPQSNAVDDLLTAEELLSIYAGLKGIPDVDVPLAVYKAIVQFHLESDAQNKIKTYSNGTKRKLCAAIAVLGNPELVLMDEPTTGMDPTTRRLVWLNIQEITKDNRSVILTSHNMEECDALCTRLAIMKDGEFQCLGSPQYLKETFGDEYAVSIFVKDEMGSATITNRIKTEFPSSVSKDPRGNIVEFIIPCKSVDLGTLFNYLESMKYEKDIYDFSISRTTLDQIFVDFVLQMASSKPPLDRQENHSNNIHSNFNMDPEDQSATAVVISNPTAVDCQVTQF